MRLPPLTEAQARENTAPRRDHVFNKSTREAPMAQRRAWHDDQDDFAAVALWAKSEGLLDDTEVWQYIERPWAFDDLHERWRVWLAAENAVELGVQDRLERRAA